MTDKDCDCRQVHIYVASEKTNEIIAVINYGWDSLDYYKSRIDLDEELLVDLKGPSLKFTAHQSKHADAALQLFNTALHDKSYAARIEEHYRKVSEKIGRAGY